MLLCATAFHPFIQQLHKRLDPCGLVRLFADNGYVSAPFDQMLEWCIRCMNNKGPQYGALSTVYAGGAYLMGRCGSVALAMAPRRNSLIDIGVNPHIIYMHPGGTDDCVLSLSILVCQFLCQSLLYQPCILWS